MLLCGKCSLWLYAKLCNGLGLSRVIVSKPWSASRLALDLPLQLYNHINSEFGQRLIALVYAVVSASMLSLSDWASSLPLFWKCIVHPHSLQERISREHGVVHHMTCCVRIATGIVLGVCHHAQGYALNGF